MSKHHDRRKWHQQKRWIIGSLLLFPPLGIPLLWLTRWPRAGKIGGSVLSGILLLSVLTSEAGQPTTATALPPTVEAPEAPTQAEPASSPAYEDAIVQATAATAELTAAESLADWNDIANRWQRAAASLGDVPISSSSYSQAQVKLAEYERNYDYAISQKTAIKAAAAETVTQRQTEEQVIA